MIMMPIWLIRVSAKPWRNTSGRTRSTSANALQTSQRPALTGLNLSVLIARSRLPRPHQPARPETSISTMIR